MPNEGRKASFDVAIGILWRLAIFLIAAVAFDGLLSLRTWETSYEPSNVWADEAANQGEWAAVVAAGARDIPQRLYAKEALYEKVLARLKEPAEPKQVPARLSEYRGYLKSRDEELRSLKDQITPWQKRIESQWQALEKNQPEIDAASDKLAKLTDEKSTNRAAIDAAQKELKQAIGKRTAIRDDLTQLDADRARVEVPIQKRITDLDAKIKDAETNIRAAFDATVSYARPTTFGWARYVRPEKAIHIGNREDPLHIVNDIASYGLEALIVFIICIVFVPWVLKLAGDSGDPNAAKSEVTQRVRQFLTDAFSRVGGPVAGRVVAATMVAGISAYAVNAAAQHKPEEPPSVAQAAGERGPQGQRGAKGKDAQIPQELIDQLQEQTKQLEQQRLALEAHSRTITTLTESLGAVTTAVNNTSTVIAGLTNNSGLMVNNFDALLQQVGTLNQTFSKINDSVSGIATVNATFIRDSMAYNQLSLQSLNTLVKAAETTDRKIDGVTTNVHTLTTVTMPKIESAFLQTNMLQDDGLFDRMWRGYQVTPVGIEIVRTIVRRPGEAPGKNVLDAMEAVMKAQKEPYSRAQLMDKLHEAAGKDKIEDAGALLDLLAPTILKVSRIPRGSL